MAEHYYAWVRVGDGDPEPAAITGEEGNRKAVTFGCPDPFDVDRQGSGCEIVHTVSRSYATRNPLSRDSNLRGRANEARIRLPDFYTKENSIGAVVEVPLSDARQRERDYQSEVKRHPHSYAGFGRAALQEQSNER